MKLVMILYLASIFAEGEQSRVFQSSTLMAHYFIVIIIVALVLREPDLGTGLVLFCIALSMFFMAGLNMKQLSKMVFLIIPMVTAGLAFFPYQRQRLTDFVASLSESGAMSYHVKQSIIGLARGGFFGVGYGEGKQKLFFLPEPFSDFILASFGEEWGFLGVLVLFAILTFILWRGFRIALRASDTYGALIAGGITSMILINALINAGVVVHLLPTTGLPFPFLSYGGSSLFVHMIGVGILMNISRRGAVSLRQYTRVRARRYHWEGDD
jgi:cell division protein FtsW